MSTTFRVLGTDKSEPETPVLEVTEQSGVFDISMWVYQRDLNDQCAHSFEIDDISPEQLAELGVRLIQIACYQGQFSTWMKAQEAIHNLVF